MDHRPDRHGRGRKLAAAFALSAAALAGPAQAALEFQFNYTDQGTGFNDRLSGAARRAALEQAAQLTSAFFPNHNGVIRINVNGSATEDSTLAYAFSNGPRFCVPGFDNRGDVHIIALGGADPDASAADGEIAVNFEDVVWDLDDSIDPNAFDFKSTLIHELLHALGFSGTLGEAAQDACGTTPPQPGGFTPFDKHLGDASGPIIDNSSAVMDAARWTAAVTGGTGYSGLVWQGSNGKAANNGQPIPLYSPQPYSNGSSIAHLDDDFYTGVALLMEAATGTGQGVRTLSAIESGIMADIGYNMGGGGGGGGGSGPAALPLNGSASGTLAAGATDSYTLSVTQPGTLVVTSSGVLDLVGGLSLNGEALAANDDIDETNRNFQITLAVITPGDYLLQVAGYSATVAGSYSVSAAFTPSGGGGGGGGGGDCPRIEDDDGNLWDSIIRTCDDIDVQADEAQLYRAYSGAFARIPDLGGYNWWLTEIRAGNHNLGSMLAGFLYSQEFLGLVNAPNGDSIDNAVFLNHVFQNVFGRAPDTGGFNFWIGELQSGRRSQARVLEEMTQSNEFVEKTLAETVQFMEQRRAQTGR